MLKVKIIGIFIAVLLCLSTLISASALGPIFATTSRGVTNSVEAYCQVGYKADGSFETQKGKTLKNCKVKIREGSYDSGWITGTNWADGYYKRAEKSKRNNVLYTCYANWSWVYKQ